MADKKKRKNFRELANSNEIKKPSPEALKRIALITFNSLILTVVYFGFMQMGHPIISPIVTICFWVGFGISLLIFVIYNRGFTQRGITREMLPDSWSEERKTDYIEDIAQRSRRSKWMLAVIIPLMIPIMLDALMLFTLPIIKNIFN